MEIVIVRHGETDWNIGKQLMGQKDIPLNEHGREQAEILRQKLSGMKFDRCYTSPLARAKETAEIICGSKCKIICDDNLKERSGGRLEGKVINNWGDYQSDITVETDAEILERARKFLESIKGVDFERILVVSHNGLLKNLRHLILRKSGPVDYASGNLVNCDFEVYDIGHPY